MGVEIKCEKLREFLDAQRAESHNDELKESVSMFPVRFTDLSQGASIRSVERLR